MLRYNKNACYVMFIQILHGNDYGHKGNLGLWPPSPDDLFTMIAGDVIHCWRL